MTGTKRGGKQAAATRKDGKAPAARKRKAPTGDNSASHSDTAPTRQRKKSKKQRIADGEESGSDGDCVKPAPGLKIK
jgi:hypothetical protein